MATPKEFEGIFLIADLSGYTALTEAHGNISAAKIITRYEEIVRESLPPDAHLAQRVGDEVLIVGQEASGILQTAVDLQKTIEDEPLFPTAHAGIHASSVLELDSHYFGTPLNLTSRLVAHARGGQILCTQRVVDLAQDSRDFGFRSLGLIHFKNIAEPVTVFEVMAAHPAAEKKSMDPVCRMQIVAETVPARLPLQGRTYYFCSFECAKAFAEHPDRYVTD